MTLKNLLSRNGWLTIEAALLHDYPEQQHLMVMYEEIYHKLLLSDEAETDLQIGIKEIVQVDEQGNTHSYTDVCGKRQTPHIADVEISLCYALDFTTWAEWLAMPVSAKTLYLFSETEIIAHCLHTMTWFSFDEEDIDEERERLSSVLSIFDN